MCVNAGLCLCMCPRTYMHLQAQTQHSWGAQKRETEVGSEVSVATDSVSFHTTWKVTGMREQLLLPLCKQKTRTDSEHRNIMFCRASLHNKCWFPAHCLDKELTGFIGVVHSDQGFLLLCSCASCFVVCICACCGKVFHLYFFLTISKNVLFSKTGVFIGLEVLVSGP